MYTNWLFCSGMAGSDDARIREPENDRILRENFTQSNDYVAHGGFEGNLPNPAIAGCHHPLAVHYFPSTTLSFTSVSSFSRSGPHPLPSCPFGFGFKGRERKGLQPWHQGFCTPSIHCTLPAWRYRKETIVNDLVHPIALFVDLYVPGIKPYGVSIILW